MQITLTRIRGNSNQDASKDIRTALAHISHKIWIKDIQVMPSDSHSMWSAQSEKIVIQCEPQGDTLENEELAQLVEEAISLRGHLTLEKITITPTIIIPCIKQTNEDTYVINTYFAEFLARNDAYRDSILKKNVKEIF